MTAIPELETRLATLRAELGATLVDGADTAAIRERIAGAESDLAAARRTAAAAKAALAAQEAAAIATAGVMPWPTPSTPPSKLLPPCRPSMALTCQPSSAPRKSKMPHVVWRRPVPPWSVPRPLTVRW